MATDFSRLQGNWQTLIRQSMQQPNLTHGGAAASHGATSAHGAPVHPAGAAAAHGVYDPSNMQMQLSMGGQSAGPDGTHGGHDAGGTSGTHAAASVTGDPFIDAMIMQGPDWSDQMLIANKDKLGPIIDAAQATWGDARIMDTIQKNWMKAIYMALSAATGKPYYDRNSPTSARLLYVPGYAPAGAAGEIDPTNDPTHSWYT